MNVFEGSEVTWQTRSAGGSENARERRGTRKMVGKCLGMCRTTQGLLLKESQELRVENAVGNHERVSGNAGSGRKRLETLLNVWLVENVVGNELFLRLNASTPCGGHQMIP